MANDNNAMKALLHGYAARKGEPQEVANEKRVTPNGVTRFFSLADPAFNRGALRRKDLLNFLFDNRLLRSFRNRNFFHDQGFRLIEHLPFAER